MKKIIWIISCAIFFILFAGCQKEPIIELETLKIEPEIFHYKGTETANAIALDDKGLLYTATVIENSQTQIIEGEQWEEDTQRFCVYDLDGTCLQQVDVTLGNTIVHAMVIEDTTLYCISYTLEYGLVLYAVDLTTWEVTKVAIIGEQDYEYIQKMVLIGDYLYLFGKSELAEGKTYELHPKITNVNYFGEMVGRISKTAENPEVEFLMVDVPLDIYQTKEDTLMIYHYDEDNGFGFLEFSPQEETLQEVGINGDVQYYDLCSCEDGFLFMKGYELCYGTVDGMEAQITTDESLINFRGVSYLKGFVFYYDYYENVIERVCITDTLKENKEIRLLINQVDTVDMYGCGYRMIREEVDSETFSLKVLARDSDFDLYLLSSSHGNSYNIKENGVFYPLNEVPGVKEYLDACFPYLKEFATNEDGDIWMLPIDLHIPVLLYDKAYCQEQGIDFSMMDYQEFLNFTEQMERENSGKIVNVKMVSEFLAQYFWLEDSFDTERFRTYASQLKSCYSVTKNYIFPKETYSEILPEFYYEYVPFNSNLTTYLDYMEYFEIPYEKVGMIEIPKMEEELPNVGTCTFFAVNSESKNLEATLSYLSTLCTYLMTLENSFLLADKTTYDDISLVRECYQLYENGAIYFVMDKEVYEDDFMAYLEGSMELEEMIEEVERRLEIYRKE